MSMATIPLPFQGLYLDPLWDFMATLLAVVGPYKIGLLRFSTLNVEEDPEIKIWGAMTDMQVARQCPDDGSDVNKESLRMLDGLLSPVVLIPEAHGMLVDCTPGVTHNPFFEEQVSFINTLLCLTEGDICVAKIMHRSRSGEAADEVLSGNIYISREHLGEKMYFRISPIPPKNLEDFRIHGGVN